MTKLLTLITAVTLIILSADPASAGWRRNCRCRGQVFGRAWYGQPANGQANCNQATYNGYQGTYNGDQGTYYGDAGQAPSQSVNAGYPPTDAYGNVQGTVQGNVNVQTQAPAPATQAPAPARANQNRAPAPARANQAPAPAKQAPIPENEELQDTAPQPKP